MSSADRHRYGMASAIVATMRTLGQMLSLGLTLLVFSVIIGPVQLSAAYAGPFLESARVVFSFSTFLCIMGIFASLARGRLHSSA
jgi:hypothetical protein